MSLDPTRGRRALRVRVRHEPSRASFEVMARGYERVVPIGRHEIGRSDAMGPSVSTKREPTVSRREGIA